MSAVPANEVFPYVSIPTENSLVMPSTFTDYMETKPL